MYASVYGIELLSNILKQILQASININIDGET